MEDKLRLVSGESVISNGMTSMENNMNESPLVVMDQGTLMSPSPDRSPALSNKDLELDLKE